MLPLICRPDAWPAQWINSLFWMLARRRHCGAVGIPLGIQGLLSQSYALAGIQGWEFLQIGRLYHYILFAALAYGASLSRGVWPALKQKQSWSLPNWMVYMIAGIIFMFPRHLCRSRIPTRDRDLAGLVHGPHVGRSFLSCSRPFWWPTLCI